MSWQDFFNQMQQQGGGQNGYRQHGYQFSGGRMPMRGQQPNMRGGYPPWWMQGGGQPSRPGMGRMPMNPRGGQGSFGYDPNDPNQQLPPGWLQNHFQMDPGTMPAANQGGGQFSGSGSSSWMPLSGGPGEQWGNRGEYTGAPQGPTGVMPGWGGRSVDLSQGQMPPAQQPPQTQAPPFDMNAYLRSFLPNGGQPIDNGGVIPPVTMPPTDPMAPRPPSQNPVSQPDPMQARGPIGGASRGRNVGGDYNVMPPYTQMLKGMQGKQRPRGSLPPARKGPAVRPSVPGPTTGPVPGPTTGRPVDDRNP